MYVIPAYLPPERQESDINRVCAYFNFFYKRLELFCVVQKYCGIISFIKKIVAQIPSFQVKRTVHTLC